MAKLNTSTIIVVAQLALVMNAVVGFPVGTSSISERDTFELEPRVLEWAKGVASKGAEGARAAGGYVAGKGGKRAIAKQFALAVHEEVLKNGGYGDLAVKGLKAASTLYNKRDLESTSMLETRNAPYIYLAGRDESGSPGKRDLEGRSWNRMDARGYGSMNGLD